MKRSISGMLIFAITVVLSGCQSETYSYRYMAGSPEEYRELIAAWIPNSGAPAPLAPDSQFSNGGWVLQSSSGRIITLSVGSGSLPCSESNVLTLEDGDYYDSASETILVSKVVPVDDPYLNEKTYTKIYYQVPARRYCYHNPWYYDHWPYRHGHPWRRHSWYGPGLHIGYSYGW